MSQSLSSFDTGLTAVVCGASGGIGRAFVNALGSDPRVERVLALSRSGNVPEATTAYRVDIEDEASIEAAAREIGGPVDLVVVTTGILHDGAFRPEKNWNALDADDLARSFAINAIGPALVAKHFLPLLPKQRKSVFAALSARVGSIEDNRLGGWYGYRASKAALNQLLRTLSIELKRTRKEAVCIGLHPGTVDSGLSKPFQSGVPEGKLFTPEFSATKLLAVINNVTPADTGRVFAWDGERVPA